MLNRFLELLGLDDISGKFSGRSEEEIIENEREEDTEDHSFPETHRWEDPGTEGVDPAVVLCRQENCLVFRSSIISAIAEGKVVIADLRKMEKEEGQQVVDLLSREAHSRHGIVSRLCPGVFIASSRKTGIEEWIDEKDQRIE